MKRDGQQVELLKASEICELHRFASRPWPRKTDGGEAKNLAYVSLTAKTPSGEVEVTAYLRKEGGRTFPLLTLETEHDGNTWTEHGGWSSPLSNMGLSPSDIESAADRVIATLPHAGALALADFPGVTLISADRNILRGRHVGGNVEFDVNRTLVMLRVAQSGTIKITSDHPDHPLIGFWNSQRRFWTYINPATWQDVPQGTSPDACGWREDYFPLVDSLIEAMRLMPRK